MMAVAVWRDARCTRCVVESRGAPLTREPAAAEEAEHPSWNEYCAGRIGRSSQSGRMLPRLPAGVLFVSCGMRKRKRGAGQPYSLTGTETRRIQPPRALHEKEAQLSERREPERAARRHAHRYESQVRCLEVCLVGCGCGSRNWACTPYYSTRPALTVALAGRLRLWAHPGLPPQAVLHIVLSDGHEGHVERPASADDVVSEKCQCSGHSSGAAHTIRTTEEIEPSP